MYLCKSCNLNFSNSIEYNNHLKSFIHTENKITSSTKLLNSIPSSTKTSDSISFLENIKNYLKKFLNDIDKILI